MNFTNECRVRKQLIDLEKRITALENNKKNQFDLNNDGKVDKKDASIASKVMANRRKKLR